MKKTKNLIIMVVILVVLIAAYAFWRLSSGNGDTDNSNGTTTTSPSAIEHLTDLSEEDVEQITLSNSDDELVLLSEMFEHTSETSETLANVTGAPDQTPSVTVEVNWSISDPKYDNLSQRKIDSLVNSLLRISVINEIPVDENSNLSVYGISDDSPKVEYVLNSGEVIEVLLGAEATASGNSHYYLYNVNNERLGVSTSIGETMLSTELDLLNDDIFTATIPEINGFLLKRDRDEQITLFSGEARYAGDGSYSSTDWTINEPISWAGNDANVSTLIGEVLGITANEFFAITDETNLSSYGLEVPRYEITLQHVEREPMTILIGGEANQNTYAMLKDSSIFFNFPSAQLTNIGAAILDFYDPFVALIDIVDINGVDFRTSENEYISHVYYPTTEEINSAEDGGYVKPDSIFVFNGRDADVENEQGANLFSRYYQALIGITIEGLEIDNSIELIDPEYQIVYKMRTGEEDIVLDFVRRDDNSYYVFKDDVYLNLYVGADSFTSDSYARSPCTLYAIEQLVDEMNAQSTRDISEAEFEEMKQLKPIEEETGTSTSDTSGDN